MNLCLDVWQTLGICSSKHKHVENNTRVCDHVSNRRKVDKQQEDVAVTNFRNYLKVNTEQPRPDYAACGVFLKRLFGQLDNKDGKLKFEVYDAINQERPFFIMTIEGSNKSLPSLMLYSHTDVVQTHPNSWKYDPYGGVKDDEGNIFGRGAQDMKSVGIQYFEAIRRQREKGIVHSRTVHIVWAPDEENGGEDGMNSFRDTDRFKKLNVGFVLDEGAASEDDDYRVYYGERLTWWVKVTCKGSPGHGSKFIENTAAAKMQSIVNNCLEFRQQQLRLMNQSKLPFGEVTTLNLTVLKSSSSFEHSNVVPEEIVLGLDIRVTPTTNLIEFERKIDNWCQMAGSDVTYEFLQKGTNVLTTPVTIDDPWFSAFDAALQEEKCTYKKEIFPAATDSRFLREKKIPCIGFSPMIRTKQLMHADNEYINEKVFLRGIEIYETLILKIASVARF